MFAVGKDRRLCYCHASLFVSFKHTLGRAFIYCLNHHRTRSLQTIMLLALGCVNETAHGLKIQISLGLNKD